MTPEQQREFDELKQKVDAMQRVEDLAFIESIRRRLSLDDFLVLQTQTKGVNSEDVVINEAGSDTKTVLGDPIGFIKIGTDQNIPIYAD